MSHEKSITIEGNNGGWVNIPTVYDGVELTDDEAEMAYRTGQLKPLGDSFFTTVEEAVEAAKQRSSSFDDGHTHPTGVVDMPNDMIGQLLQTLGVEDPRYTDDGRPMARRGRGGVGGAPQSEGYEGDLPDPDNAAQMSRYAQEEAFYPGDPAINESGMYNTPAFQEAVAIFTEQNGYEPATDSDFEMGVLPIMMQIIQGGDTSAAGAQGNVLKQMGE